MKTTFVTVVVAALAVTAGCDKGSKPAQTPGGGMTPGAGAMGSGGTGTPGKTAPAAVEKLWALGGLDVPESVQHDPARKVLYVSCINGKPTAKDGNGYIARVSLTGKLLTQKWVTGLDAPKGMGLRGDTLYVTDITRLHVIDVTTGKIKQTIDAPATKFLNDIAMGPSGQVYVSDMATGIIHVLKGDKLDTLVNLKSMQGANGMLMQGDVLLVGTATGIVQVTPADGKAKLLVPLKGFGMIDGLKADGEQAYLVSNWKGRTQRVTRAGKVTVLLDTTAQKIQSADLEYIAATRLLIIPTFFHNQVVAYRVR